MRHLTPRSFSWSCLVLLALALGTACGDGGGGDDDDDDDDDDTILVDAALADGDASDTPAVDAAAADDGSSTDASCVRASCQPTQCGAVDDGCGDTLACGACEDPLRCGVGGTPSTCEGCLVGSSESCGFGGAILVESGCGDTSDANNLKTTGGFCGLAGDLGGGAPDQTWEFVAPATDDYSIVVSPGDTEGNIALWDVVVSVRAQLGCAQDSCIAGADDFGAGSGEVVTFEAIAGQSYYVIVDGKGDPGEGPYQIFLQ